MIRKTLLIVIMLVSVVLLGYTVYAGVKIGDFEIFKYKELGNKSKELKLLTVEYEEKNDTELSKIKTKFSDQISEYREQKQKYEEILKQKETDLKNYDTANCYDVDFLWTRVGNYATQHGLDLEFNVSKNSADQENTEYILADLNFIATGDYIEIANFIEELEKDVRLEFEIRNFAMKNEKIKDKDDKEIIVLKATFTVYNVAINKGTLTQLTTNNSSSSETPSAGF